LFFCLRLLGNTAEAYGFSKDAGAIGESGVLEKYGVYPIAALTLAAAISKELIIMNEVRTMSSRCLLQCHISHIFRDLSIGGRPGRLLLDSCGFRLHFAA